MLSANFRQAMNDRFHYDALVDDALRSVVRRVLTQVAEKGLPGSHHFYISFRSTDPGVELPDYLRAKYPEEMTIVLQHQYWDLIIGADYLRGDGELQQAAGAHKGAVRRAVGLRRSVGALRPAVRPQGQGGGGRQGRGDRRPPTPLPAPDKRPPLAAPSGSEAKPEAKSEAGRSPPTAEAKPEDPPPRSSSSTASERSS